MLRTLEAVFLLLAIPIVVVTVIALGERLGR
jgi:hypothetical protein